MGYVMRDQNSRNQMPQKLELRHLGHINYYHSKKDSAENEDQVVEGYVNLTLLDIQVRVIVAKVFLYIVIL